MLHKLTWSWSWQDEDLDSQDQDFDSQDKHQVRDLDNQDQDLGKQDHDQDFQKTNSSALETKTMVSRTTSLVNCNTLSQKKLKYPPNESIDKYLKNKYNWVG